MENKKKLNSLDNRSDDSKAIEKLTREAVDDWEDFELIRKMFPRPESNPDPIPYPFAPERPAKWKHGG